MSKTEADFPSRCVHHDHQIGDALDVLRFDVAHAAVDAVAVVVAASVEVEFAVAVFAAAVAIQDFATDTVAFAAPEAA